MMQSNQESTTRQADGSWTFAGGQDTALVFYIYRESLGQLEMVLSGFSGRATRLLARTLAIAVMSLAAGLSSQLLASWRVHCSVSSFRRCG